ncbi:hypothetical protein AcV7_005187 [Taiwanofungus camphoratus]|nr:hypothetical protein AcV7_005187 [Antrodia cinnamomea]
MPPLMAPSVSRFTTDISTMDINIPDSALPMPASMKRIPSVARAMGLHHQLPIFRAFTKGLRDIAPTYLDERFTFKDQDEQRWELFFEEARKKFPWVDRYQNAWPIEAYMRSRLEHTKYEYRKCKRKKNTTRKVDAAISNHHPCLRVENSSKKNSQPLTMQKTVSSIQKPIQSIASSEPTTLKVTGKEGLLSANSASSGTRPVRMFLRSLNPNQEDLADNFIQAGVVDAECLKALAEMPEAEKVLFLKEAVKVNDFQVYVVKIGLAKYLPRSM